MKILTSLVVVCLAAVPFLDGARAAAAPVQAAAPDRSQIESMLIEAGYSCVASLRLDHSSWVGLGAHDGMMVRFVVDAATGRLVSEVQAK